jgi:hypothetical protein
MLSIFKNPIQGFSAPPTISLQYFHQLSFLQSIGPRGEGHKQLSRGMLAVHDISGENPAVK